MKRTMVILALAFCVPVLAGSEDDMNPHGLRNGQAKAAYVSCMRDLETLRVKYEADVKARKMQAVTKLSTLATRGGLSRDEILNIDAAIKGLRGAAGDQSPNLAGTVWTWKRVYGGSGTTTLSFGSRTWRLGDWAVKSAEGGWEGPVNGRIITTYGDGSPGVMFIDATGTRLCWISGEGRMAVAIRK
jgi:hypothetical protein